MQISPTVGRRWQPLWGLRTCIDYRQTWNPQIWPLLTSFNPQSLEKSASQIAVTELATEVGGLAGVLPWFHHLHESLQPFPGQDVHPHYRLPGLEVEDWWPNGCGKKMHPHWNSSKKMADSDCTLLLIVTWDIRLMSTITGFSKSMSRINFIKTPMIVCSIPESDSGQPPHGVNEVVELDISIHYHVWHVYVHPKSPNC